MYTIYDQKQPDVYRN